MKQWICGANPQLKFTKKGMAYNLNAQNYLATQTSVFLASIYGDQPGLMNDYPDCVAVHRGLCLVPNANTGTTM